MGSWGSSSSGRKPHHSESPPEGWGQGLPTGEPGPRGDLGDLEAPPCPSLSWDQLLTQGQEAGLPEGGGTPGSKVPSLLLRDAGPARTRGNLVLLRTPGAGGGVSPEWLQDHVSSILALLCPQASRVLLSEPQFSLGKMQPILPVLEGTEVTELGDPWGGLGVGLGRQ